MSDQKTTRKRMPAGAVVDIHGSWPNAVSADIASLHTRADGLEQFKEQRQRVPVLVRARLTGKQFVDGPAGRFVEYSWVSVLPDADRSVITLEDLPTSGGGPEEAFTSPAYNLSEAPLAGVKHTGLAVPSEEIKQPIVYLHVFSANDGKVVRYFVQALPEFFAVQVFKRDGVAGDAATQCSFVYEVKDLEGNTLADSDTVHMEPEKRRREFGRYALPDEEDGETGVARWDAITKEIKLWDANEVVDVTTC